MALPAAFTRFPRAGQWLAFEGDGAVIARTGKVELGQGLLTALAQIVADGLGVDLACVCMVSGDTACVPDEGLTTGSLSIEVGGAALAAVTAFVRARLLDHAAQRLDCAHDDLQVERGRVLRAGRTTGLCYWRCADALALSDATVVPVRTGAAAAVHVGRPEARIDLPAKLHGGAFIHDLHWPGMRQARVLRQPFPGAELRSLDGGAWARRHPDATLVRQGHFVACVADSEHEAEAACATAQRLAQWSEPQAQLQVPADVAPWLQAAASRLTDLTPQTPAAAAGPAVLTRRAVCSRPFLAHASIGLCCAIARVDGQTLQVWTHSQGVFALRDQIARVLGWPAESVRVRHHPGAGCYGHNGADDVALDAALVAAQMPGHPVRVQWSREDELCHAPFGPAMAVGISSSLDAHGHICDWSTDVHSPSHSGRPGSNGNVNLLAAASVDPAWCNTVVGDVPEAVGGGASRNALPIYRVPVRALRIHTALDLPVRTSALRALGAFANVMAIESMMDELAEAAGIDAVEFRLRHLDDPCARAVLEKAAALAHWPHAPADGQALGLGLARYKNRSAWCAVVVAIELEAELKVRRAWCAVDAGRLVNPDGARNQIEGGIVQSISWATREAVRFEGSTPLCRSWDDYPILRFSDVPEMETVFVGDAGQPSLGVGEASQGPTVAAVVNAQARASGVRIRDLPLDRERLLSALS